MRFPFGSASSRFFAECYLHGYYLFMPPTLTEFSFYCTGYSVAVAFVMSCRYSGISEWLCAGDIWTFLPSPVGILE